MGDAVEEARAELPISIGGSMTVTINVSEEVPLGVQQLEVSEFVEICSFSAQVQAGFTEGVFDQFAVQAAGPLGVLDLSSTLTLNPSGGSFESWQGGVAFSVLTVDIVDTLYITLPQTASYNQFVASGSVGDCSFQFNTKMSTSPTCFQAANACFGWPTSLCGATANACTLFTDEGFDNFTISLGDLLWYESPTGLRALLDATFTFTTDVKIVDVAARLDTDWGICPGVEAIVDLSSSTFPLIVDGIDIQGLIFELQIGDVTASFAESLDEASDSSVTGKSGAAERFGIAAVLGGCCGSPGSFTMDTYFERDPGVGASLFNWFRTEIGYELPLFDKLTVGGDAWYAAASPVWGGSITISFNW
ncbi:hypothetical protein JW848_07630 [Candidatus Bipolaricaulota bacterium]|nr:hypothetical protein [Candidatus Bipolaricaulota bacterium]